MVVQAMPVWPWAYKGVLFKLLYRGSRHATTPSYISLLGSFYVSEFELTKQHSSTVNHRTKDDYTNNQTPSVVLLTKG